MNLTEDIIRKMTCTVSFVSEQKKTDRIRMRDGAILCLSGLKKLTFFKLFETDGMRRWQFCIGSASLLQNFHHPQFLSSYDRQSSLDTSIKLHFQHNFLSLFKKNVTAPYMGHPARKGESSYYKRY